MTQVQGMDQDQAWALIELQYDDVAPGRAALARDMGECRFRLSITADSGADQRWGAIVEACHAIATILDREKKASLTGFGAAYTHRGDVIAYLLADTG